MKKSIIITITALLFSVTAFAQQTPEAPKREMPTVEQIAKRKAERLRQQLLLGDKQYDKVYKLCLAQAEKDVQRMQQMKAEKEQMAADMKGILNESQYEKFVQMQNPPRFKKFPPRRDMPQWGDQCDKKGGNACDKATCDKATCDKKCKGKKCKNGKKCDKCRKGSQKGKGSDKGADTRGTAGERVRPERRVAVELTEGLPAVEDQHRNKHAYHYSEGATDKK
ncbi:MAG: hypothetical protein E7131_04780 [Rikenellaceae bacterium]|nr:hypothetical protein [Rikenellaceae bacterium]